MMKDKEIDEERSIKVIASLQWITANNRQQVTTDNKQVEVTCCSQNQTISRNDVVLPFYGRQNDKIRSTISNFGMKIELTSTCKLNTNPLTKEALL